MDSLRATVWLEFLNRHQVECSYGFPPAWTEDWDVAGIDFDDEESIQVIAASTGLSLGRFNEVVDFANNAPPTICRDRFGGFYIEWPECLAELCHLAGAGLPLDSQYLVPWFGLRRQQILDAIDRGFRHRDAYVGHESDGLQPADLARSAIDDGLPVELAEYLADKVAGPDLGKWANTRLDVDTIREWLECGFAADGAGEWIAAGVNDPHTAGAWTDQDFEPAAVAQWRSAGFGDPEEARTWGCLVNDPHKAGLLRAAGLAPDAELAAWLKTGLSAEVIARRHAAGVRAD